MNAIAFKGYLRYNMITSENVVFKMQFKNIQKQSPAVFY